MASASLPVLPPLDGNPRSWLIMGIYCTSFRFKGMCVCVCVRERERERERESKPYTENFPRFFPQALEIEKKDRMCLVARASCHFQVGNFDQAVTDADRAIQVDKRFAQVLMFLIFSHDHCPCMYPPPFLVPTSFHTHTHTLTHTHPHTHPHTHTLTPPHPTHTHTLTPSLTHIRLLRLPTIHLPVPFRRST
jgi:hypothetical protein